MTNGTKLSYADMQDLKRRIPDFDERVRWLRRKGFIVMRVRANPDYAPDAWDDGKYLRQVLRFFRENPAASYSVHEISHEALKRPPHSLYLTGSVDHPPHHAYNSSMAIVIDPTGPHRLIFRREYFKPTRLVRSRNPEYEHPVPGCLLVPNASGPDLVCADPETLQLWAAAEWKRWVDGIGKGYSSYLTLRDAGPVVAGLIRP